MPDGNEEPVPVRDLSSLLIVDSKHKGTYISRLAVKPGDQQKMSLGTITDIDSINGFRLDITPDPSPENSIVSTVTSVENGKIHRLMLQVANYGDKKIEVSIWRL